jgi:hypothetical protein
MSTTEISSLSLKDLVFSQDNSIDIRDCYVKTGIEGILQQLDEELVGLKSVKTRVREISISYYYLTVFVKFRNYRH